MSTFREKINSPDEFLITCEISPPRGPDTADFESKLKDVKGKVSAVNITDNPMTSVRMSPAGASFFALRNGVEPIMQITCRDRNILGLTSELISAHSFGVRNILVLWGDPPRDTKGVFEVDVIKLIQIINNLNEGIDFRGEKLNSKCDFLPGAALNPFDERVRENAEGKAQAGAKFFQTQPVFDIKNAEKLGDLAHNKNLKILIGVIIVPSEKVLENVRKFAKGITIPPELEESILKHQKQEDKEKAGIDFATQLILKIKEAKVFKGVHIYSPAKESLIPKLLNNLQ